MENSTWNKIIDYVKIDVFFENNLKTLILKFIFLYIKLYIFI